MQPTSLEKPILAWSPAVSHLSGALAAVKIARRLHQCGFHRLLISGCYDGVDTQDMNQRLSAENLGEPALKVAEFRLWIHGREFPEADDYYDGNWLRATVHCGASGANVWAHGAILMVTDLASFETQCHAMFRGDAGSAVLDPLEPELCVSLESTDHLGHIRARVAIWPDHLARFHKMEFAIDQSYLLGIIKQCSAILQEYPILGDRDCREGA